MIFFYQEFSKIGLFLLFSLVLSTLIIFLASRFSIYNPDTEKLSAYECGFDPYEDARNVFDIRFYLVAILFLIFDLETCFIFSWSLSLSFLSIEGFWVMLDFIVELLLGFFYAWAVEN